MVSIPHREMYDELHGTTKVMSKWEHLKLHYLSKNLKKHNFRSYSSKILVPFALKYMAYRGGSLLCKPTKLLFSSTAKHKNLFILFNLVFEAKY